MLSLEEELTRRKMSALNALPSAVRACIDKLQTSMNTLKVVQRLDELANLISAAAETLRTDRTNRREKIYKQFLNDVRQ